MGLLGSFPILHAKSDVKNKRFGRSSITNPIVQWGWYSMDLPIWVEKHNTNRKAFKTGRTEIKLALAQQTLAEIALRPKLDCRKLSGDVDTLDAGLKGLSPKLWSLRPIVTYNREPDGLPSVGRQCSKTFVFCQRPSETTQRPGQRLS